MASYDPYWGDVKMLLLGNGTNDSQTITDEKGHTVTVGGNTCIKTATKKFGTGSIYFDGDGDYLQLPIADFHTTGGQDFTIDGWIYPTAFTSGASIMRMGLLNFSGQFGLYINNTSGGVTFSITDPGSHTINSNINLTLNTWTYIAVSRVAGVFRMYFNSSKVGELTSSIDITYNIALSIGGVSGSSSYSYTGYIDDLRFTKYGRYSTDVITVPAFESGSNNIPPAITISGISPATVPVNGGTTITVTGSGFSDFTTCIIDSTSLSPIFIVSDTELAIETPAKSAGFYDVVIENP